MIGRLEPIWQHTAVRRLLNLLILPLICAVAAPARAQGQGQAQAPGNANADARAGTEGPRVVAVLSAFNGAEAGVPPQKPLHAESTARAVRDLLQWRTPLRYKVLSPSDWRETARRHFHGHTTELQGIARSLGADIAVGGWLEAVPPDSGGQPYRLTVAVYDNWAQPLGQVAIDVPSEHLRPELLAADERVQPLYTLIDRALGLLPPEKMPDQGQMGVVQEEDRESAPLRPGEHPGPLTGEEQGPLVPPTPEAHELYYQRPPWRPLFDLQAGYLASIRHFTDNGSDRSFNTSAGHGIRLHGELYPLALTTRVPVAFTGLGVRLDVQLPFWKDAALQNQGGQQTGTIQISEWRVEAAWLRWHWNFLDATLRPDVEIEALYGYHSFGLQPGMNVAVLDLPPVAYSYMGASVGTKLYLMRRLWAHLNFAFAGMLDLGPMADPGAPNNDPVRAGRQYHVYGPGSGWLWRMDLSLALRIVRGLQAGIGFYYEQDLLSFDGTGDILLRTPPPGGNQKVTAATDEYGGVFLTLGYVY